MLEDRLFSKGMEGDVSALKFLLIHTHPRYKKKKQKERSVHIYHHVDRSSDKKNLTLEDIIDDEELLDIYLQSQGKRNESGENI